MLVDTGDWGEFVFGSWCSAADMVANKVTVDKRGWDFCVAFRGPTNIGGDLPADMHPPDRTALVQVKASRGFSSSVDIALSNWRNLALDPRPAFVVFVEGDEHGEVKRALVLHVDRTQVERVLRRLRHLTAEHGDGFDPRKHELAARLSDAVPIGLPYGGVIRDVLRAAIGDDPWAYSAEKARWAAELGEPRTEMSWHLVGTGRELSVADQWRLLCDHLIGLEPPLPARVTRYESVRFDTAIPLVSPFTSPDADVTVRLGPVGGTSGYRVELESGSCRVELPVTMLNPAKYLSGVPEEAVRLRFSHPGIDFILSVSGSSMQVHRSADRGPMILRDLERVALAGDVLDAPGERTFRLILPDGRRVEMSLGSEDLLGELPGRDAISELVEIVDRLNLPRDCGVFVPALVEHAELIAGYCRMLRPEAPSELVASFEIADEHANPADRMGCWTLAQVPYGSGLVLGFAMLLERPERSGSWLSYRGVEIRVVHAELLSRQPTRQELAKKFLAPAVAWFDAMDVDCQVPPGLEDMVEFLTAN